MKLLIDTHCWLWWVSSPRELNDHAVGLLANPKTTVYFSAASAWEIAIKAALGKLALPEPAMKFVPSRIAREKMTPLPIELEHALRVETLPPHHRDPFDRLLLAQAISENLPLLTADEKLKAY